MKDSLLFNFHIYQNRFKQPLQTSHGVWKIREGIIIQLTDKKGKNALGEIAPLPWFGSETLPEAKEFCQRVGKTITEEFIFDIPDNFPTCQFAFESAFNSLKMDSENITPSLNYSYLLPAGIKAIATAENILCSWQKNTPVTFKWKIAVKDIEEEIAILKQLVAILPPEAKLRLDANGGLNLPQAKKLLKTTENILAIEYIEQPLSPDKFDTILSLSKEYSTPMALDESVASLSRLQQFYQKGWQGIYIIKAAIMGYPSCLSQFCFERQIDAVFSSVFETKVGRQAVLNLAAKLGNKDRAVGFSKENFLNENF